MKTTLSYLSIILGTFFLCFLQSSLLTIPWFMAHWVRQFLVLVVIFMTLGLGGTIFWTFAKKQSQ
ncbi:hypothetical protein ACOKFD_15690 [Flagellimonas sp. S174]|uniref:hypothetical protein n=1 Tax=Flagellimonas sp. S174 TaxID=3410790 RepID=UPI003BF5444A